MLGFKSWCRSRWMGTMTFRFACTSSVCLHWCTRRSRVMMYSWAPHEYENRSGENSFWQITTSKCMRKQPPWHGEVLPKASAVIFQIRIMVLICPKMQAWSIQRGAAWAVNLSCPSLVIYFLSFVGVMGEYEPKIEVHFPDSVPAAKDSAVRLECFALGK